MDLGPRAVLASRAKRGDALAQILTGRGGWGSQYPAFETIRAAGRLVPSRLGVATVDHALCREILRDRRFATVTPDDLGMPGPLRGILARTDPGLPNPVEPPAMLVSEPPDHTRYRQLVARSFTPRSIETMRDRVGELSRTLLDRLEQRPTAELIGEYATMLPVTVIAELLGLPDEAHEPFIEWGEQAAPLLDVGLDWRTFRRACGGLRSMDRYLRDHFARLRADGDAPGESDPSAAHPFTRLARDGELTERELITNAALLVGAGFETTVNLIGNGVVLLLQHPEQLAALREDPGGWPNAVEEILRFESPVQMTGRTATEPVTLADRDLPAGAVVSLLLAGANRDPAVFDRPGEFDITRTNARDNLAFGTGIHACIGAALARMEATVALPALFERFPDLGLATAPDPSQNVTLHGFRRVEVRLGRARKHV
ncbi:cytochrome P450 [Tsukamurella soli]